MTIWQVNLKGVSFNLFETEVTELISNKLSQPITSGS